MRRRLTEWIDAQAQIYPDLVVLTGLRPGAELLGAEAAIRADVPYAAVMAFPDQDRNLAATARSRFVDVKGRAVGVVAFEKKSPADSDAFRKAMARRDTWLVNAADQAVLVWDEQDNRLDRLHAELKKTLGDDLFVLRP